MMTDNKDDDAPAYFIRDLFKTEEAKDGKRVLVYTGDKPETELDAWHITLGKWLQLAKHKGKLYSGGTFTCGLCMFYNEDCRKCPIGREGYIACTHTPNASYHLQDLSDKEREDIAILEVQFLWAMYEKLYPPRCYKGQGVFDYLRNSPCKQQDTDT